MKKLNLVMFGLFLSINVSALQVYGVTVSALIVSDHQPAGSDRDLYFNAVISDNIGCYISSPVTEQTEWIYGLLLTAYSNSQTVDIEYELLPNSSDCNVLSISLN